MDWIDFERRGGHLRKPINHKDLNPTTIIDISNKISYKDDWMGFY